MFAMILLIWIALAVVVCHVGGVVDRRNKLFSAKPPNFPSHIPLRLATYKNWSNELIITNVWFATPSNDMDVVSLANWAFANNFTLRASGFMHNWSPLTVTKSNEFSKNVVLIETRKTLIGMELTSSPYSRTNVKVGTGVSMIDLLTFLEKNGLGMYSVPAPGDLTIGGVLAVGGHGTSVLAIGEKEPPGFSYGTVSNLITSLTAVVWSPEKGSYHLKTFKRSEADTKAFLIHLGRTFVTEVTLMVGPNYNLRCISRTDISNDELFADPKHVRKDTKTFSRFLDQTGRVETILFPFTKVPWLKVWSISPKKPRSLLTKKVNRPYDYIVPNIIPEFLSVIVGNVTNSLGVLNPLLGNAQRLVSSVGNLAFLSFDIWGPSKNLLLYVKKSTLRQTGCGFAIITRRTNVQRVVSQLTNFYTNLLRIYSAKKLYPVNGVLEIRASKLDESTTLVPDGESPSLSAVNSVKGHPEFDIAVWVSVLSFPGAPHQNEAYRQIERFIFDAFNGKDAYVRIEWSKGFAYTAKEGAWTDYNVISDVRSKFPTKSNGDGWNFAVSTLNKYDPYRIFTNEFLDKLLVEV